MSVQNNGSSGLKLSWSLDEQNSQDDLNVDILAPSDSDDSPSNSGASSSGLRRREVTQSPRSLSMARGIIRDRLPDISPGGASTTSEEPSSPSLSASTPSPVSMCRHISEESDAASPTGAVVLLGENFEEDPLNEHPHFSLNSCPEGHFAIIPGTSKTKFVVKHVCIKREGREDITRMEEMLKPHFANVPSTTPKETGPVVVLGEPNLENDDQPGSPFPFQPHFSNIPSTMPLETGAVTILGGADLEDHDQPGSPNIPQPYFANIPSTIPQETGTVVLLGGSGDEDIGLEPEMEPGLFPIEEECDSDPDVPHLADFAAPKLDLQTAIVMKGSSGRSSVVVEDDFDPDIPSYLADFARPALPEKPDMGMAQMVQFAAARPNPLGINQEEMNFELSSIMQELSGGSPLELDNSDSDIPSFDDSVAPTELNELGVAPSGFNAEFDSILESLEAFRQT